MAVNENSIANLKTAWKKGESGNPNGKPKGTLSRKTLVRYWLEQEEDVKNPITGDKEKMIQADIMTLALIKKARQGDVAAYKELMDSGFGKIPNDILGEENSNNDFKITIECPK